MSKFGGVAAACMLAACISANANPDTSRSEAAVAYALDGIAQQALRVPLQLRASDNLGLKGEATIAAATPGDAIFGDVSIDTAESPVWPPATRKEFLAVIWPHAERVAREIGVTPHAVAAQAALESGWGRRLADAPDGEPNYNLFGIKAGRNWTGERSAARTHEYVRGVRKHQVAEFRSYESIEHAFDDYLNMLRANDRYKSALKHGGTSRHFARRLQRAGYSTDPQYATKIHRIANSTLVRSQKKAQKSKTPTRTNG